jgi:segregation and condensation protein B
MSDQPLKNPEIEMITALEAILFVAALPLTVNQLAEALGQPGDNVESGLKELSEKYALSGGLSLQWHAGRVQLTTAPHLAEIVEKYLGLEATSRLSRAALETLAIVAYRQPITRPAIDVIRGVSSDGVLRSLLSKGLLQEGGRGEGPGRPILYETTPEFLQHFGLSSIDEMPPFEMETGELETTEKKNELLKD